MMKKTMMKAADRTADGIKIHTPSEFDGMRAAGRITAEILDEVGEQVRPGVSTGAINDWIHEAVLDKGATSATIGYRGYKHASCISVNHVVCHGVPDETKKLRDGDVLNIDVTVVYDGWFGDSSRMYVAGQTNRRALRLIDITHEALMRGIASVKPGATFGDLGHAIQTYAEANRCSVVRQYCGHGIGRVFHDNPSVVHYGKPGAGPVMEPGMFFTIEPMVNLGRADTKVLADQWTVVTRDRSLSAQFEHSVGVTETGVEIFTPSPGGRFHPLASG